MESPIKSDYTGAFLESARQKMADGRPLTFDEVCAWTGKTKVVLYKWRTRRLNPLVTSPGRLILPKRLLEFLERNTS